MQHKIHTERLRSGVSHTLFIDDNNRIDLVLPRKEDPFLAIGVRLDSGQWFYQNLHWSCRGGRQFWWKPMLALYRHICREKLTPHSLRFLAWGERRQKNNGLRVNTPEFRAHRDWCREYEAKRAQEGAYVAAASCAITCFVEKHGLALKTPKDNYHYLYDPSALPGQMTATLVIEVFPGLSRITEIKGKLKLEPEKDHAIERLVYPRSEPAVVLRGSVLDPQEMATAIMAVLDARLGIAEPAIAVF